MESCNPDGVERVGKKNTKNKTKSPPKQKCEWTFYRQKSMGANRHRKVVSKPAGTQESANKHYEAHLLGPGLVCPRLIPSPPAGPLSGKSSLGSAEPLPLLCPEPSSSVPTNRPSMVTALSSLPLLFLQSQLAKAVRIISNMKFYSLLQAEVHGDRGQANTAGN